MRLPNHKATYYTCIESNTTLPVVRSAQSYKGYEYVEFGLPHARDLPTSVAEVFCRSADISLFSVFSSFIHSFIPEYFIGIGTYVVFF